MAPDGEAPSGARVPGDGEVSHIPVEELQGTSGEPVAEGSLLPIDGDDSFFLELLHLPGDRRAGEPESFCDLVSGCSRQPEKGVPVSPSGSRPGGWR